MDGRGRTAGLAAEEVRGSGWGGGSRCQGRRRRSLQTQAPGGLCGSWRGHKQAAQGGEWLNAHERKQDASSLGRLGAGVAQCTAAAFRRKGWSAGTRRGLVAGTGGGGRRSADRQRCAGQAEARMNERGLGVLALSGRGSREPGRACPASRTQDQAASQALLPRKRRAD